MRGHVTVTVVATVERHRQLHQLQWHHACTSFTISSNFAKDATRRSPAHARYTMLEQEWVASENCSSVMVQSDEPNVEQPRASRCANISFRRGSSRLRPQSSSVCTKNVTLIRSVPCSPDDKHLKTCGFTSEAWNRCNKVTCAVDVEMTGVPDSVR